MNPNQPRNLPASVHDRLLNIAHQRHVLFQRILTRYAVERLLYRFSQSPHRDRFILKGAMLFLLWKDVLSRPTRDLDLLGQGDHSQGSLEEIFRDLCRVPVEEDGLQFLADSVTAEEIREEDVYAGIRVRLLAMLGRSRIPLQVDIGFGDAVTPAALEADFPVLLPFPVPRLRVYPRETVIAEKYQAMVELGLLNSRMKDFYDLWTLAHEFSFSGPALCQAIAATFARRRTPLPQKTPTALSPAFSQDEVKGRQWQGFLNRNELEALSLPEVTALLSDFLMPPTHALVEGRPFNQSWLPGRPWSDLQPP